MQYSSICPGKTRMTPTTSEKSRATHLLDRFITMTRVLRQVYEVTIYGQQHREVILTQILEKLGAKVEKTLTREDLRKAIDQVNAMSIGDKTISVTFTNKQADLIKMVIRTQLRVIRNIPSLARIQLSVTLAANFEGYVADALRIAFNTNPDTLKSSKSTLKDEEIIDAVKSGDILHVLIENKVRNIMYGSANDWTSFLKKNLGFKLENTYDIEELFLIRNCILHNNGNVSRELQATKKKRYRNLGRPINITERDINRYLTAAIEDASAISREYTRKFCASES